MTVHFKPIIAMVSYVIQAANYGKDVIRMVISDDTDVFVRLVYWVHRAALQCKVQKKRWNGTVLDINATSLGTKCLVLAMYRVHSSMCMQGQMKEQ